MAVGKAAKLLAVGKNMVVNFLGKAAKSALLPSGVRGDPRDHAACGRTPAMSV